MNFNCAAYNLFRQLVFPLCLCLHPAITSASASARLRGSAFTLPLHLSTALTWLMNGLHQGVDVLPYLLLGHIPVCIRDGYAEPRRLLIPFSLQQDAMSPRVNIPGIATKNDRAMVGQCFQNRIHLGFVDIIINTNAVISHKCPAWEDPIGSRLHCCRQPCFRNPPGTDSLIWC
jgi:hypothetical protein